MTMIYTDTDHATEAAQDIIEKQESFLHSLSQMSLHDALSKFANDLVQFGIKVLVAILVFYIGKFIIKKLYTVCRSLMMARHTDASLITFVLSLLKITLYFILVITIVGILGLETSSFLALFASAGVAIGMALSGTLQNFAGGVLILLLKPYRVGDYIEAQGYSGTVKAIQIFHTIINTNDNKAIIIPNGGLSTGSVNNYSLENYRRVDWTVALSYGTDYSAAREAILKILNSDARVVKKYIEDHILLTQEASEAELEEKCEEARAKGIPLPEECEELDKTRHKSGLWNRLIHSGRRHKEKVQEVLASDLPIAITTRKDCSPFVGLGELADNSINLTVRAWTRSSDYWGLFYDINERLYSELPEQGFSFPFPQLDVHVNP